jgi:hypothetical protein
VLVALALAEIDRHPSLDLGRELPHLIAVVKDQAYIGKRIVEVAVWEVVGMPERGSVPGCEVVA